MESDTLRKIQKLAKFGKVVTMIVFIGCLIGVIGCGIGLASFGTITESIQLGKITIHGIVGKSAQISDETAYAAMGIALVMCLAEGILAKKANTYFKHELADGTPFTFDGARELFRLGISYIIIPFVGYIGAAAIYAAVKINMGTVGELDLGDPVSIGMGLVIIFVSLICRYGAEIRSGALEQ